MKSRFLYFLSIAALALVYFCAGKFGLHLASVHANATAIWPPTGIALAALLILGHRLWPAILIGAFLVNYTTDGTGLIPSLGIALGNTIEALVGAWLVQRFANGANAFKRARTIFKFILLAGFFSPMISATIGSSCLMLRGSLQLENYPSVWLTWWMGDLSSNFIVAPLLLLWSAKPQIRLSWTRKLEAALLLISLLVVGWIVFGDWRANQRNFPFLSIPFLLWAAFRFGRRGAATTSFVLSALAIWGTINNFGPFAVGNTNQSLLLLQAFMCTMTATMLIMAATVSERQWVFEALRDSERKLRLIAENTGDAIVAFDLDRNMVYANPALKELTGYTIEDIREKKFINWIHPDDNARMMALWEKLYQGEGYHNQEFRLITKDGQTKWCLSSWGPLKDEQGRQVGVQGRERDITDYKRAEEALRETEAKFRMELERRVSERTDALQEVNGQMESFCYSISHDLRAPLRAMRSLSQVLIEDYGGAIDENGRDFLKRISTASERMDRLINDLLEYSRLARMEVTLRPVQTEQVIEGILIDLRMETRSRNATVRINKPLPNVLGNETLLQQIFLNLISNALKFSKPNATPEIEIGATTTAQPSNGDEPHPRVNIYVRDNGIGIAKEHHERIFRVFERLHGVETYPGTGIGLAIVQRGAERLGGQIKVESNLGEGSCFWLDFPKG